MFTARYKLNLFILVLFRLSLVFKQPKDQKSRHRALKDWQTVVFSVQTKIWSWRRPGQARNQDGLTGWPSL